MKPRRTLSAAACIVFFPIGTSQLHAQGLTQTPGFQGLEQLSSADARSRSLGAAGVAWSANAASMFDNPANLGRLTRLQATVGASYRISSYDQQQEWIPNRLYAGLSLVFENNFAGIKDSALQKPFDAIGPDWQKRTYSFKPALFVAAMPLITSDVTLVGGIGYSEVANLDLFYQNNNVLDPNIGAFRPAPILRPKLGDTVNVRWYQAITQRSGSLYGITPAVAVQFAKELTLGLSATLYNGSIDDHESRLDRGFLRLTAISGGSFNSFLLNQVPYNSISNGSSKFSGTQLSAGIAFDQPTYSLGLRCSPAVSITREWTKSTRVDSTGRVLLTSTAGTDEIRLPFQFTVGVALHPSERWNVLVDYDVRSLNKAEITQGHSTSSPWLSGKTIHLGAEYRLADWLDVRAGYFENVMTFAGQGDGLITDPVRASAYSVGAGLSFGMLGFDIAYEFISLNYNDLWESNINQNSQSHHRFTVETRLEF